MNRVLILTAGFGNGHNAAAFSVRDGLETVSEDVQVEVLDLFAVCYGRTNELVRKLFLGIVQYAPKLWEGMYSMMDRTSIVEKQMRQFGKMRRALAEIIATTKPDVIVTTYPAYNFILDDIYKDHRERPYRMLTVVTDSITINSVWYGAFSDHFFVANQPTAEVMRTAGVSADKILVYGFPVSPRFAELAKRNAAEPDRGEGAARRLFYIVHHGKKKLGPILEQLLEIPNLHLTIACGTDPSLKARLVERTARAQERVRVLGWTNQMPEILAESDLVVTKAGGAIVQEALAACCPMLVNQILPGQEEGNAKLIEWLGLGAVATDDAGVLRIARAAMAPASPLWRGWKESLRKHSRPDAALRIAEFILDECRDTHAPPRATVGARTAEPKTPPSTGAALFSIVRSQPRPEPHSGRLLSKGAGGSAEIPVLVSSPWQPLAA